MKNILAFPSAQNQTDGMQLRDYFAAKAMAGDWGIFAHETSEYSLEMRASLYYRMADAMLQAREKGGTTTSSATCSAN